MADVFDIDSSGYHGRSREDYNHRNSGGWIPVDSRKDPRLNRRDDSRKYSPAESPRRSPQRSSKSTSQSQMYNQQISHSQQYQQQAPPPPMYSDYNSGYGAPASYNYQHQQPYQHPQNNSNYGQYNQQSSYPQQQGYNTGHHQPGPPGDEYSNSWGSVPAYPNMSHPAAPPPVPRPPAVTSATHTSDSKNDDLKKEAIAQEMKQQRATLIKQRDEYLRKASVLRRELEKLKMQKHELLSDKSPPRDAQRILRENAKLQLEIQNKLKSINNVVDMLSGIIGDGLKTGDDDLKTISSDSSPKRSRKHTEGSDSEAAEVRSSKGKSRERETKEEDWPQYNYIHYDPELHWCRVCDVFPRSAKDFLNHMHSAEHRQVTQEHQLVDTPWHKLPTDPELPSYKGAPVKRVPIKGLQFFISATSWYCKLCDVWIGDLHCASLHLKSKNHSHNYSNFVEQNPHWETNWLKDREKAYARCAKAKAESGLVPPTPEPPVIKEKLDKKLKSVKDKNSVFLEPAKDKKRKKKSKKRKKNSSDSSSSSSSSDSSSEDESDKAKSIRVAMRNKMRMQAQLILNEEIGGKLEALRGLVEEKRNQVVAPPPPPLKEEKPAGPSDSNVEDNIINQWMTVTTNHDKHILDNLKGRLKQRQEADKEKSIEAAAEQRRREREREERELKEMREREQRELEQKMREEKEKEERERQEREQIKERERNRRKRRSESRSPSERGRSRDRFSRGSSRSRGRSRSRSVGRRRYEKPRSPPERYYREEKRDSRSPEFRPPRRREKDYSDDEYEYKKGSSKRLVSTLSSSRKLPFIGRMPLFKKRGDGEEKEIKKEDYEIRLSKFEPGQTARGFIPEPGVVHIPKLYTAPEHMPPIQPPMSADNPPPPPKIIPEPPQISETAPPPPIINDIINTVAEENTAAEVQDMELDEAAAPLPPGVPIAEGKPLAKPAGNHLPRDFQDALNIIFPGDQAADPNLMMQYQYQMGYGMMYPGMSMYDYAEPPEETELMPEDKDAQAQTKRADEKAERDNAPPGVDDKEDLAMLGIDAEDMAAQTI